MAPTYTAGIGKHQPQCGGRCLVAQVGEDNYANVSGVLILVPTALWMVYVAPHLWRSVSVALPFAGVALFVCSVLSLCGARLVEPGILPTKDIEGQTTVGGYTKKVVQLNGRTGELEAYRAKYVRETGNAIERFDHFCPWVGNVVGKRNYRHFVMFLTATNLLSLLVLVTTATTAMSKSKGYTGGFADYMDEHSGDALVMVGLLVYVAVILLCVGGLWLYHLQLICSNKTTNEDIKQTLERHNPYDLGCCSNCSEILCSPVRTSYLSVAVSSGAVSQPRGTVTGAGAGAPQQTRSSRVEVGEPEAAGP